MPLQLRPAAPGDLALLRRWEAEPHVAANAGDDGPWDWEAMLAERPTWRELLIAELSGRPIGFLQIIDPALEETHYWGDVPAGLRAIDIWIGAPDMLGRGNGTAMMQLALKRSFADPAVSAILIDPLARNTRAQSFYARLGFVPVGRRRFDADDCLVMRLDRAAWEAQLSPSAGSAGRAPAPARR